MRICKLERFMSDWTVFLFSDQLLSLSWLAGSTCVNWYKVKVLVNTVYLQYCSEKYYPSLLKDKENNFIIFIFNNIKIYMMEVVYISLYLSSFYFLFFPFPFFHNSVRTIISANGCAANWILYLIRRNFGVDLIWRWKKKINLVWI